MAFKGFGNKRVRENTHQDESIDFKQLVDEGLKQYEWLKDKLSTDKKASMKLAQTVMRLLGFQPERSNVVFTKEENELNSLKFARMATYFVYQSMAYSLVENGTPVEKMTPAFVVDCICEASDEQLLALGV